MIDCGKPNITNGLEFSGDKYTVDSEVKFNCKPGFKMMSGDEKRKCKSDGNWNGKEVVCKCK